LGHIVRIGSGVTIVSASWDKTLEIWGATSGWRQATLKGYSDFVCAVDWSFDGNMLASASLDRKIRLWDVGTGKALKQFLGHSNQDHTQCCYFTSSAC